MSEITKEGAQSSRHDRTRTQNVVIVAVAVALALVESLIAGAIGFLAAPLCWLYVASIAMFATGLPTFDWLWCGLPPAILFATFTFGCSLSDNLRLFRQRSHANLGSLHMPKKKAKPGADVVPPPPQAEIEQHLLNKGCLVYYLTAPGGWCGNKAKDGVRWCGRHVDALPKSLPVVRL